MKPLYPVAEPIACPDCYRIMRYDLVRDVYECRCGCGVTGSFVDHMILGRWRGAGALH